jgi:outer membrane beta-barrel protein
MKRPAICFFVWFCIVGWAGVGNAKGAGKGAKPAPAAEGAPAATDDKAAGASDASGAAADPNAAPAGEAVPSESLNPEADLNAPLPGGDVADAGKAKPPTTLSWQDIVVVPRKAFLKGGRVEFAPFTGVSINDNLIRHYAFGADITYFLSDVFSVGVEGQYYVKALTGTEENIGLQYNRIPTLNKYLYGGSLNFGYVPIYGKFAWFNKQIMHWEIFFNGGVGVTQTEIIPRNPGNLAFKNLALTVPLGVGTRFFLFNWLTVNFAIRDYLMTDKFEPANRLPTDDIVTVKANAEQAWVNNVMVYAGVGIYLPTKFSYKTPR